jgi:hypothetical protein
MVRISLLPKIGSEQRGVASLLAVTPRRYSATMRHKNVWKQRRTGWDYFGYFVLLLTVLAALVGWMTTGDAWWG